MHFIYIIKIFMSVGNVSSLDPLNDAPLLPEENENQGQQPEAEKKENPSDIPAVPIDASRQVISLKNNIDEIKQQTELMESEVNSKNVIRGLRVTEKALFQLFNEIVTHEAYSSNPDQVTRDLQLIFEIPTKLKRSMSVIDNILSDGITSIKKADFEKTIKDFFLSSTAKLTSCLKSFISGGMAISDQMLEGVIGDTLTFHDNIEHKAEEYFEKHAESNAWEKIEPHYADPVRKISVGTKQESSRLVDFKMPTVDVSEKDLKQQPFGLQEIGAFGMFAQSLKELVSLLEQHQVDLKFSIDLPGTQEKVELSFSEVMFDHEYFVAFLQKIAGGSDVNPEDEAVMKDIAFQYFSILKQGDSIYGDLCRGDITLEQAYEKILEVAEQIQEYGQNVIMQYIPQTQFDFRLAAGDTSKQAQREMQRISYIIHAADGGQDFIDSSDVQKENSFTEWWGQLHQQKRACEADTSESGKNLLNAINQIQNMITSVVLDFNEHVRNFLVSSSAIHTKKGERGLRDFLHVCARKDQGEGAHVSPFEQDTFFDTAQKFFHGLQTINTSLRKNGYPTVVTPKVDEHSNAQYIFQFFEGAMPAIASKEVQRELDQEDLKNARRLINKDTLSDFDLQDVLRMDTKETDIATIVELYQKQKKAGRPFQVRAAHTLLTRLAKGPNWNAAFFPDLSTSEEYRRTFQQSALKYQKQARENAVHIAETVLLHEDLENSLKVILQKVLENTIGPSALKQFIIENADVIGDEYKTAFNTLAEHVLIHEKMNAFHQDMLRLATYRPADKKVMTSDVAKKEIDQCMQDRGLTMADFEELFRMDTLDEMESMLITKADVDVPSRKLQRVLLHLNTDHLKNFYGDDTYTKISSRECGQLSQLKASMQELYIYCMNRCNIVNVDDAGFRNTLLAELATYKDADYEKAHLEEIIKPYAVDGFELTDEVFAQINEVAENVRAALYDLTALHGKFDISPKDIQTLFDMQDSANMKVNLIQRFIESMKGLHIDENGQLHLRSAAA